MEPTDSPAVVVCDAGPLIHLDELDSLDLLADFKEVLVPVAVWEEVERHRPEALKRASFPVVCQSVEIVRNAEFQALVKAFTLGAGEQAALSLMHHHPAAIFLSDDAAARLACKALRFRSQGTIGILLRSLRRGQRTREEVLNLLAEIPSRSTLHIQRGLLKDIIKEVEELLP